jgi:DNA-binding response OmpR family regulator
VRLRRALPDGRRGRGLYPLELKPPFLVVENDGAVRDFLVAALERAGLDAIGLDSAEAAIAFTFRDPIAGAIIDIGLPGLSGVGLVRALRRQVTTAQVPLLVLTGDPNSHVEALDAGADDYLTKPVATVELVARVQAQARAWGRRPKHGGLA